MNKISAVLAAAASFSVALLCASCQAGPPRIPVSGISLAGAKADLKFETSDFMRRSAYRNVDRLDRGDAPSGAYSSVNQAYEQTGTGKWYIENQRFGGDLIIGGVAGGNTDAISRGLHILQWGFNKQQNDGGWNCPDAFHSASFFVEAAAHGLLILKVSPYASQFASQIADMTTQVAKGAHWLDLPSVKDEGKRGDSPFAHRRYLLAAALGEAGVLAGDKSLVEASQDYAFEGISMQNPTGFNPEKGGYDSSYNAVGLWFCSLYYTIVAPGRLQPPLYAMLKKGVAWEASRISPDGTVITQGNTRVGGQASENNRNGGGKKKPSVGEIFRAFAYWSQISGDTSYLALAQKVADANHMYKGA